MSQLDKPRDFSQWLHYLESLNPHKIKLGLDRIKQVAQRLQVTSFECSVITVTGTNGKGSTVAFLESIFLAANYRVATYTSPHLLRFNERIRINGVEITNDALCQAFSQVEQARDTIELTYFEFTTLAAFILFKQTALDVLILEVGLGGRLDAVNIIDADVAVITSVGIDHVEWLGNDRDSIGYEKAGIFRANKFAVCGDNNPPQSILQHAKKIGTKLFCKGNDFSFTYHEKNWSWKSSLEKLTDLPLTKLDIENAATALMVLQLLSATLPVNFAALRQGLQQAFLPARMQKIGQCIFDVAHNPQAAEWLAGKLKRQPIKGQTFAVVGMLADKDIPGTLRAMLPVVKEWYVGDLSGPRAAQGQLLIKVLQQMGVTRCYSYVSVAQAYKAALKVAQQQDRVVVFGSFHTIANIINFGE